MKEIKKQLTLLLGIFILFSIGALCEPANAQHHSSSSQVKAQRHIVTASGKFWYYRGQRSGIGEYQAVRILAAEGDTIEFRQTSGSHSVFFYASRPGQSELGRRVDVDLNFRLADEHKLERLSNRLFDREGLTAKTFYGRTVAIIIKGNIEFNCPIYFGCSEHVLDGREFGVIAPTMTKPSKDRTSLPPDFRFASTIPVEAFYPYPTEYTEARTYTIGRLAKIDDNIEVLRGGKLLSVKKGEEKDLTQGFFRSVPNEVKPDPVNHPWYHIAATDLDDDGDLDLVVAVGSPEGDCHWWVLESNVADKDGLKLDEMRFMSTGMPISTDKFPAKQAAEAAFSIVADVNSDNKLDLILYDGNLDGKMEIYFNVTGYFGNTHLSFRKSDSLINTGHLFKNRRPNYVYPYDFDFDGWIDLLVGADSTDAVVFFNNTKSQFSEEDAKLLPGTSAGIQEVGLRDVDADGIYDLLLKDTAGSIHVYYNNGDRMFSLPKTAVK